MLEFNQILISIMIFGSNDYENKVIEIKRLSCVSRYHNSAVAPP